MTDQNISNKISDAITSVINKTNISEKLNNIKSLIKVSTGIFIVTTTITIINYYYIKNIERKTDEQIEVIKHMNRKLHINNNSEQHFELYQELKTKIDTLLEINIKISNQNNMLLQNYDKKYISTSTSMSDFKKYFNSTMLQNNDIGENVDNESLDDYFDILPL